MWKGRDPIFLSPFSDLRSLDALAQPDGHDRPQGIAVVVAPTIVDRGRNLLFEALSNKVRER